MSSDLIDASYYSNSSLGVSAVSSATLYMRKAANALDATASSAINIGTLISNQTQLDVESQVTSQNQSNYYSLTYQGQSPIKLSFTNQTNSAGLRVQLIDSKGDVVADSSTLGTTAQQTAYSQLTSSDGLTTGTGNYTVKVTYDSTSPRINSQVYTLNLYSGTSFANAYKTTASTQTSSTQHVPVDNTMTWATSDAKEYSAKGYHAVNEKATEGVQAGWLYENKTALSVTSQLTQLDNIEYYNFTLQKDSAIKFAFNNTTDTADLRVQILDASGTRVLADSNGTDAQKKAYAELTSSTGLQEKSGNYVIKVTYDKGVTSGKTQNYDFQLYAGDHYTALDKTTASAESYSHALAEGHLTGSYNATAAAAAALYDYSQGTETDILSVLATTA